MIHLDYKSTEMEVIKVPGVPHTYEFYWSNGQVGVGIVEIFFGGEQIPESPIRVQVEARHCDEDFPGKFESLIV